MEPRFVTKDNCKVGEKVKLNPRSKYWGQNFEIGGKECEGIITQEPYEDEKRGLWWCKVSWSDGIDYSNSYRVSGDLLDLYYTQRYKVALKVPKISQDAQGDK